MTKEVLWKRAWKVAATLGFAAASLGVRADGSLADYPRRAGEADDLPGAQTFGADRKAVPYD